MAYWNDKTVIVTGGAGFLGSYVVEGLHRRVVLCYAPRSAGSLTRVRQAAPTRAAQGFATWLRSRYEGAARGNGGSRDAASRHNSSVLAATGVRRFTRSIDPPYAVHGDT